MAVFAALLMVCVGFAVASEQSQAIIIDGENDGADIPSAGTVTMAPGFKYVYNITFDTTLNADVLVSAVTGIENELPSSTYQLQKTATAESHDVWGTLTVTLPSEFEAKQYNLVLKATHEASGQTAYQYIVFDVKNGVTIQPTTLDLGAKIQGQQFSQEFTVTAGFGNVASVTVASEQMDDISQPSITPASEVTFTVTGTMDTLGTNTVTISGLTDEQEVFSQDYTFSVYSAFSGTFTEDTIGTTDGTSDTSAITSSEIPSDISAGLTYVANIPEEYQSSITDNGDGTVTVTGGNYIDADVTITATHTLTSQSKTQTVHVHNEASNVALQLGTAEYLIDGTFWTYVNAEDRTFTVAPNLEASTGFSGIESWDVSGDDVVVKMSNGTVTIDAPADAAASAEYTITAVTNFGKTITTTFNLVVEGLLSVSEGETFKLINTAGQDTYDAEFTASAANAELSYAPVNTGGTDLTANLNEEEQSIHFQSSTAAETYTYTLTVSTLAGQSDDIVYTVNTFAKLSFNELPENGVTVVGA